MSDAAVVLKILAVEDGCAGFKGGGDDEPVVSRKYSALIRFVTCQLEEMLIRA
jgi:hypothetical protein